MNMLETWKDNIPVLLIYNIKCNEYLMNGLVFRVFDILGTVCLWSLMCLSEYNDIIVPHKPKFWDEICNSWYCYCYFGNVYCFTCVKHCSFESTFISLCLLNYVTLVGCVPLFKLMVFIFIIIINSFYFIISAAECFSRWKGMYMHNHCQCCWRQKIVGYITDAECCEKPCPSVARWFSFCQGSFCWCIEVSWT